MGCLPRHAGQGKHLFHRPRDLTAELLYDFPGRPDDVLGLVAKKARRAYFAFEDGLAQRGEVLGSRIFLEQPGSDFVDSFIRALGRKDGGDQELEWVFVSQGALGLGEKVVEGAEDFLQSLRRPVVGRRLPGSSLPHGPGFRRQGLSYPPRRSSTSANSP